jgi:hypothetical protein
MIKNNIPIELCGYPKARIGTGRLWMATRNSLMSSFPFPFALKCTEVRPCLLKAFNAWRKFREIMPAIKLLRPTSDAIPDGKCTL